MAVTFRRVLTPGVEPGAGEFTVETESKRARLGCPVCGFTFDLPRGCGIDQVGRSSHAVQCQRETCSFWDWCELADHWLENP